MAVYETLLVSLPKYYGEVVLGPTPYWPDVVSAAREEDSPLQALRRLGSVVGQYAGILGAHMLVTRENMTEDPDVKPPLSADENEAFGTGYVQAYSIGANVAELVNSVEGARA